MTCLFSFGSLTSLENVNECYTFNLCESSCAGKIPTRKCEYFHFEVWLNIDTKGTSVNSKQPRKLLL